MTDTTEDPKPAERGRIRRFLARRWVRIPLIVTPILIVVVGVGTQIWIRSATDDRIHTVADAPSAPVGIVLGAGLRPDGSPKPYLEARLADTLTLYREGRIQAVLVSGDHGTVGYDEVLSMTRWLVANGVPERKVVSDHAGFDTYDSCVRAKRIFGVDKALVITQAFHVRRAVFLCRDAGIDVAGVGSDSPGGKDFKNKIREIPAGVKAVVDAVFEPDPRYLGKYETGVDDALTEQPPG